MDILDDMGVSKLSAKVFFFCVSMNNLTFSSHLCVFTQQVAKPFKHFDHSKKVNKLFLKRERKVWESGRGRFRHIWILTD